MAAKSFVEEMKGAVTGALEKFHLPESILKTDADVVQI